MARLSLPVYEPRAAARPAPLAPPGATPAPRGAYYSCDWLEGGLAFNRRSLHACLIVHHGRGFPHFCDFNGGPVPVEAVLAARRRIVAENQTADGHAACRGCPHLVKRRWRKRRYPFDLLGVAQFAYCNIECTYCYLQTQEPASFADGFNPYPVLPAIRGIIEAGQLAPRSLVDWGGGEPTIYKEFDELLARLTAHGCSHWIHTNGTRLPKPLLNGLSSKRIHVLCSLDAGTRETYRLIKKKDFFDRVWRNLERYVDLGCHVVAKYIMTEENCERRELELFIDRVKRTGIRSIVIDIDYNFPDPSPRVLAGLAMLKRMAFDRRIHAGCGFTGAKFTPEMNVEGKIDAAGAGRARGGIGALRDGMMRAAITADRVSERLGRMLRR